jgi:flagellar protein FliL
MSASETQDKPKKSRKLILIGGVAALCLLCGGGYFGWRHFHGSSKVQAKAAVQQPAMLTLPTIMSNLDAGDGHTQFVKLNARLEVARAQDQAAVEAMMPQILNVFQTYLHETRPDELSGGGLYRLREAMLQQIANTVAPIQIRDLYFTELLTQ